MALSSYADLQAAVQAWLDRADLAAQVPDFIRLAEADLSRRLRVPDMEARATATVPGTTGRVTLPPDLLSVRAIHMLTGGKRALDGMAYMAATDLHGSEAGRSMAYALSDGQLWLFPRPEADAEVEIIYRRAIPALSVSNPTNWLLASAPDLYLFASLLQGEFFGWNDQRLPLLKTRVDEMIEQVNREGRGKNFGGGMRMHLPHAY